MAQWLDRIKFGSGKDGSPAVSGTINTYATCTGTATQTSLTTALTAINGDVILIHQSQGTGAGQWEINQVSADAGATLTLKYPLAYTYGTGAQAVLVPQYLGGNITGDITGTSWNGTVGGIVALMSKSDLTISGSIKVNGVAGSGERKTTSGLTVTSGGGFRGGGACTGSGSDNHYNWSGEGTVSNPVQTATGTYNANGNGGGGGWKTGNSGPYQSSGAGGGNGTAGQNGNTNVGSVATGGPAVGNAGLTNMVFGGGGGGGASTNTEASGLGGSGGGIILIFAKNFTLTGVLEVKGGGARNTEQDTDNTKCGGGGAGGSVLIKAQTATLGTNLINANNTQTYTNTSNGGVGRIHIDYADTYTGTTTPTIDAAQVTSLKSQFYGGMI